MNIYRRNKVWYIDYYLHGKRIRKKLNKSKQMAELIMELNLRRNKKEFFEINVPKNIIFNQLAEQYLEYSKTNKRSSTYTSDISIVKKLRQHFDDQDLMNITAFDGEQYKNQRIKDVSGSTVNREVSCLKHMLNKAVDWNYLNENPLRTVKKFKEPPGRIRYLQENEILKLIESCADYLRPIVITALNTGMRKSEILKLRWQEVDLKNRIITLTKTKNNEIRSIPINNALYKELLILSNGNENEFVFTKKDGKPFTDIRRSYKTALKRAGIENFRFHDLRHNFGSWLVMSGENIRTVQELLGHKDIKMTMRYSHLSVAHKMNAVNKLDFMDTNRSQKDASKIPLLA
jgi:integrase